MTVDEKYYATVQYLFHATPVFENIGASAYKSGLENTLALDEHFHHPHLSYPTIHVAGTNGKGSCSHSVAAVLQAAGYRVGLYTSPHLVDFRERIRVDGVPIPKERVITFVEKERAFFEPLQPSFFELTTALAFLYFKEQKVDVAVIEVGLGGRLDCTNIIRPILSIITNISFDHMAFLGDTLAKIANEKAGIIKSGTPVVIGETTPETRPVFLHKAMEVSAPIIFAEENPEIISAEHNAEGGIDYQTAHFGRLHSDLNGEYQKKNMNTILTAIHILITAQKEAFNPSVTTALNLPGRVSIENIRYGLAKVCLSTGLKGRWQILRQKPLVVCDTGHNLGGWQYIATQIKAIKCKTRHIVFGMVDDKDIDGVMELLPSDALYYWCQASSKRAIPSATVAARGQQHGLIGTDCGSVVEAYRTATKNVSSEDFIFVGGSSYVVADLLSDPAFR